MNATDRIAWQIAILVCRIEKFLTIALLSGTMRNADIMHKTSFIGKCASMDYLISTPPNEMPDHARKQMLMQGRFVLAVFALVAVKFALRNIL